MPWGRIDDTLYDHPKLERLGRNRLACVGLYMLAVSWCNRYLTDGHVPAGQVRRLGGTLGLADELVEVGMWEHAESGGYQVHDFLEYNESKAEVLAKREAAKTRMKARRSREHTANVRANNQPNVDDVRANKASDVHANIGTPKADVRDSRARAGVGVRRRGRGPGPTRPDPSRGISPEEIRSPTTSREAEPDRPDVQALLDRGFRRVTPAQRAILDEVLDLHNVTGAEWAAAIIRSAPSDADPLAAVKAAHSEWQAAERDRVLRAELEWTAAKLADRHGAERALGRLREGVG